jgi:hypothetical protein
MTTQSDFDLFYEKFITRFTSGDYYNFMAEAKDIYFNLTGKFDEESYDFDARMNCFSDWYFFHHKVRGQETIFETYLKTFTDSPEAPLQEINYSLFLFSKLNWKKQVVLKDILHDKTVTLSKSASSLGLIANDLFIGRTAKFNKELFLLRGICTIPIEVLSVLKKSSKKIRKLNHPEEEIQYLLKLESLKNRAKNYGHIAPEVIFKI